ncbi:lysozyme-like [Coccinella septempunctata]|uniref:lysozyme-like n=1 Tax=Coccinella septempunctata TaxID=41139 RepID=UPI001D0770F9|nr:lysozyme-like [Coccinella septempunctata]
MSRLTVVSLSLVLGVFLTYSDVSGKKYTKCGLTNVLEDLAFPRSYIGNWVCLIESESGKNSSKVTIRANNRLGLGLFQILSRDWCTFRKRGGLCNVRCEDMLDESLVDDAACAKKVQKEQGFKSWNGWNRSCKRRNLPIPNC